MSLNQLNDFQWEPCPEAQKLLDERISDLMSKFPTAARLSERMRDECGTRFFDWIDHITLPESSRLFTRLKETGFEEDTFGAWDHPGAIFPRILIGEKGIAIKVEEVSAFLAANQIQVDIQGLPFDRYRYAEIEPNFKILERRGYRGFQLVDSTPDILLKSREVLESFCRRQRDFEGNDPNAFESLHQMIDGAIKLIGRDWACEQFFAAERAYWMLRNQAGRVQKARQDSLGLGWANHDHHTYRCRRQTFHQVIEIFEAFGFNCRERFYAGAQAGWGAQIVEHPATGVTIFADVDMSAEEVTGDFAHDGFKERNDPLGTVGLWCELHGESLLEAGMHHLEAQFDFNRLSEQILKQSGIGMMKPFTNFDYLRQQFTEGERWPVEEKRITRLLESGDITQKQADSFRVKGAVGSHLENLERNDGFKGFNQVGISDIIERTDARKLAN